MEFIGIFMRQKYKTIVHSDEYIPMLNFQAKGEKNVKIMIRQKFFYPKLREWKESMFRKQTDGFNS